MSDAACVPCPGNGDTVNPGATERDLCGERAGAGRHVCACVCGVCVRVCVRVPAV